MRATAARSNHPERRIEGVIGALEYRIGSTGALRSVPIASLAGSGPAFVDIGY